MYCITCTMYMHILCVFRSTLLGNFPKKNHSGWLLVPKYTSCILYLVWTRRWKVLHSSSHHVVYSCNKSYIISNLPALERHLSVVCLSQFVQLPILWLQVFHLGMEKHQEGTPGLWIMDYHVLWIIDFGLWITRILGCYNSPPVESLGCPQYCVPYICTNIFVCFLVGGGVTLSPQCHPRPTPHLSTTPHMTHHLDVWYFRRSSLVWFCVYFYPRSPEVELWVNRWTFSPSPSSPPPPSSPSSSSHFQHFVSLRNRKRQFFKLVWLSRQLHCTTIQEKTEVHLV